MSRSARKTIRDVARQAGVSVATVSRVLNDSPLVRGETRQRVVRAMEKCHYIYNALAGGLSARRTKTLGVIVPTITNPIFALVTRGIQDYAALQGYSIILGNTDYQEENELRMVQVFQEKRTDGVILNGPWRDAPIVPYMKKARLPFVITWQIVEDPKVSFVAFNNLKGAYRNVAYLIELGHRRIGMIAGRFSVSGRAAMRWEGYRKCLEEHDISYDPQLVLERGYTFEEGEEAAAHLLALPSCPTALFCGNDILAIGAMVGAKKRGLRIPEDLSVIGFDDAEISAHYDPPLTTMAVPAYEMGQQAAKILVEISQEENVAPQQCVLETELVIRGSTARRKNS